MIECPHCRKDMRRVHEYLNDQLKKMKVWYCYDCDFTLPVLVSISAVKWVYVEDKPDE